MADNDKENEGRDEGLSPGGVKILKDAKADAANPQPEPPEGQEWYYPPGATEPVLRPLPEEAEERGGGVALKGKLPNDFPGHSALQAAGLTTYAKVRKSLGTLEEIDNIGPSTAERIRESMNESNEAEEEAE